MQAVMLSIVKCLYYFRRLPAKEAPLVQTLIYYLPAF